MKKKVKIIATMLIAAMIGTSLSACGTKTMEAEDLTEEASKEIEEAAVYYGKASADAVIFENVSIDGVDVGGMTLKEAEDSLNELSTKVANSTVKLVSSYGDATSSASDMGIAVDVNDSVKEAFAIGNSGSVLLRYKTAKEAKKGPVDVKPEFKISRQLMEKVIKEQISSKLNTGKKASLIKNEDGSIKVIADSAGIEINLDKTYENVRNAFKLSDVKDEVRIELVVNTGDLSEENKKLAEITDVLGTYSTEYTYSAEGRKNNIRNACDFINGTVLFPGEVFSYCKLVGPIELSNGYDMAPVIVGGKHELGVGGGVCQPSSTLYNAVLYAELEVVERSNHALDVGYVSPGRDATISDPYVDFKFKNNLSSPIYIEAIADGSTCTFTIYGKETRPSNRTIELESVYIGSIPRGKEEIKADSSVAEGTEEVESSGCDGIISELWKHIYIDGQLSDSVKINYSEYDPEPRIILKNPADIEREKNGIKPTEATTKATTEATTKATEATTKETTEATSAEETEPETENPDKEEETPDSTPSEGE